MGDFGGPLLSTTEALPVRSKSSALHVEDCQSPKDNIHNIHLGRAPTSQPTNMSQDKDLSLRAVDTPLQHSEANTPAEPATPTSDEPCKALPEPPKSKDFAARTSQNTRPPTRSSQASSNFKPSTPVRTYREHPRLWIEDGPGAGKAIAEWRQKFVPIFEEQTKDMTIEERTKVFDKMVKEDEDRYCQALATYYTVHPEHLPEREVDPKTQKKIDVAFTESPKYDMMQQKCFGDWDNWGPRTTDLEPEIGPKNEASPDDPTPECEHCVKEAKKARSLVRKVVSKLTPSKDKHDKHDKPARRATVDSTTQDKRPNVVLSIPDQCPEDQVVDDHDLASNHSGSSSDGKQREALTETGVGLTKAKTGPKKRMSIAQKLRLSTVHTR